MFLPTPGQGSIFFYIKYTQGRLQPKGPQNSTLEQSIRSLAPFESEAQRPLEAHGAGQVVQHVRHQRVHAVEGPLRAGGRQRRTPHTKPGQGGGWRVRQHLCFGMLGLPSRRTQKRPTRFDGPPSIRRGVPSVNSSKKLAFTTTNHQLQVSVIAVPFASRSRYLKVPDHSSLHPSVWPAEVKLTSLAGSWRKKPFKGNIQQAAAHPSMDILGQDDKTPL